MITSNFEKYHGLGNDFIFLPYSCLKQFQTFLELRNFASQICHRRTSIGADGVIFVRLTKLFRVEMLIVNSDGSLAATCGNALRCLGLKLFREDKWDGKKTLHVFRLPLSKVYEKDLKKDELFTLRAEGAFATLLRLHAQQNKLENAKVDISFAPAKSISHWNEYNNLVTIPISHCVFVQLENPHLVFISHAFKNFTEQEFMKFGQNIQQHCNANINMLEPNTHVLHVFERGAGLTTACGSGAVASALALDWIPRSSRGMTTQSRGMTTQSRGMTTQSRGMTTQSRGMTTQSCGMTTQSRGMTLQMPGGPVTVTNKDKYIELSAQAEFAFRGRIRVASA